MSWGKKVRTFHRWVSLVFMIAVIITTIGMAQEQPVAWMSYLPLPWLFLLMLTGAFLFVLPYWQKRRGAAPGA